jgi:hypothetical protein
MKVGKKKERKHGPSTPTAEEMVGRPGMNQRRYREAALERKVYDFFAGAGQFVRTQIDCGPAGRADVLTRDILYELKDKLHRRTYYQAVGQLQGYKSYLNLTGAYEGVLRQDMGVAIICNETSLSDRMLQKFECLHGVPVIVWDPPYKEDRFIPRALRRTLHLCT